MRGTQVTEVLHRAAQLGPDLRVEPLGVAAGADQAQGHAELPGHGDRRARALLRHQPSEPDQRVTARPERPALGVHAVVHHAGVQQVPVQGLAPLLRGVVADGHDLAGAGGA
ncbi:hypothetical protein BJF82_10055 [Kytococcus sp. CUA-901]|nr:hypothetical protein BJF82_10055 [Kytococcus sp. CUA-901]